MAPFTPRAVFPPLDSLPRSYYLGHHAAGLSKMRTLLSQIDLVIECRDYRIPLTSRNPMFEDCLSGKERLVVYTKRDLGCAEKGRGDETTHALLTQLHHPSPVLFSDHKFARDVQSILTRIRALNTRTGSLTGSHLMCVGMPNVGKSSLLNALRLHGVGKGKAAHTGAQPGITRKIGTSVKIVDASEDASGAGGVYLLDTPGVFIPYVPNADAMLKLALCGCVKDNIVPAYTLADYLLFHLNLHHPEIYSTYHEPTNDVMQLLDAVARKTGRLQKGAEPDLESTALWLIQRWRQGHLGRFLLDEVSEGEFEKYRNGQDSEGKSVNQMRKAGKDAIRQRSKLRKSTNAL